MGLGCNYASETSIPRIAEPGSSGSNFSTIPTSVWLEMHSLLYRRKGLELKPANPASTAE